MLTMPGSKDIYRIPDAELENYRQFVECACEEVSAYTAPLKKAKRCVSSAATCKASKPTYSA